jgi:hypothetical protein
MAGEYELPDIIISGTDESMDIGYNDNSDNSFGFKVAGDGSQELAPYEPNFMSAYLTMAQGLMGAKTSFQQADQIEYNAKAISRDIDTNIQNSLQARQHQARREHIAGTRYLAQLENSYARSGVEFGGDVANYVAEVAAVQEQTQQQRNQDLQYRISVMRVQQENQKMQAKYEKRAAQIQGVLSLATGGVAGYSQALDIKNYWREEGPKYKKYGPKTPTIRNKK